MKTRLHAAILGLVLAGCSANPDPVEQTPDMARLESLGLRNIVALRVHGTISEGQATYQAERVRFLYDAEDGSLRTWDFEPPVP